MIIIAHEAEQTLLSDLSDYAGSQEDYRCAWLRLGNVVESIHEFVVQIEPILHELYVESVPKVYACGYNNIFIVMKGLGYKQLSPLMRFLEESGGDLKDVSLELFEIRIDQSKIKGIVSPLLEKVQAQQEKAASAKRKDDLQQRLKGKISSGLVSSIEQRRRARKELEVMLVEDDALPRMLVKNMLSAQCNVTDVEDGIDALSVFVEQAPDVVFLDIGLPGIDGYKVLRSMFEVDPNAYVVMLSGQQSKEKISQALELGAQGFITKPFTYQKLCRYINLSPHVQRKKIEVKEK